MQLSVEFEGRLIITSKTLLIHLLTLCCF